MAYKIYNIKIITYRDLDVMLYEKDVKNVTIKVSPKDPNTIHVTHPKGMSDHQIMDKLEEEYDNMVEMRLKALVSHSDIGISPTHSDVERMRKYLNDYIPMMERAMEVTLKRFSIKIMKTRWGSCSPEKSHISLNAALARMPRKYLDYVVVHELAHLIEPTHSPMFWSIVRQFCPNYSSLKNDLREQMKG
jgi:hypothetical protein